jgi:hypothetical protein
LSEFGLAVEQIFQRIVLTAFKYNISIIWIKTFNESILIFIDYLVVCKDTIDSIIECIEIFIITKILEVG